MDGRKDNGRPVRPEARRQREERFEALGHLEDLLDGPVVVLGFAWLGLFVVDVLWGIGPLLQGIAYAIWVLFLVDFALRLTLAPDKTDYLRANVITILSLVLPALRVFRILRVLRVLRAARAARGVRLVQVVGSMNRSMGALRASTKRRGFGYIALLTALVTFAGAAGMLALEGGAGSRGFATYGDALWWTAMVMTTMGSEVWPQTPEGRVLGFLLAVYAFAVFGYVTAAIASILVGGDIRREESVATAQDVELLRRQVASLEQSLSEKAEEDGGKNER